MPDESYRSRDGKSYPLWASIDEAVDAAVPAYWSDTREMRRERGWMFRGQCNDAWDMIPNLYRPPAPINIVAQRKAYTESFVEDLAKNANRLELCNLHDDKLLAIAQHYGFFTSLLDFTWNFEIAAYFSTNDPSGARIGVVYGYNLKEYEEMRNPFAVWGMAQEESEKLLKEHGLMPLPISKTVEFNDVPRIYEQEGIFVEVNLDSVETFMHNCIDRFYFYQRKGNVYAGQYERWRHQFPSESKFDSKSTYRYFIETARQQKPEVFKSTPEIGGEDLFPPVDPISEFAVTWKQDHPYSTESRYEESAKSFFVKEEIAPTRVRVDDMTPDSDFGGLMNAYYGSSTWESPYQSQMIRRGRALIEKISTRPELSIGNNAKWLTWELLNSYLKNQGYRCTLRLGANEERPGELASFYFILMERWLESNYRFQVPADKIQEGWWHGRFEEIGWHQLTLDDLSLYYRPLSKMKPSTSRGENPYSPSGAIKSILNGFLREFRNLEDAEQGSCVFDMQGILMREIGRDLTVALGLENAGVCDMDTPYVAAEHDLMTAQFVVEIHDGFLEMLKRARVCALHWGHWGEAGVDLLDPQVELRVGLA